MATTKAPTNKDILEYLAKRLAFMREAQAGLLAAGTANPLNDGIQAMIGMNDFMIEETEHINHFVETGTLHEFDFIRTDGQDGDAPESL